MTTEEEIEKKEKIKTRREKLGGYFLDMSKLTFGASVLGGTFPILGAGTTLAWIKVVLGIIATAIFAWIGNKILK